MKDPLGYILLATILLMGLTGCGFHLRGSFSLPFKTIAIEGADGTPMRDALQKGLSLRSTQQSSPSGTPAEAVIQLLENQNDKQILSLSAAGKIREFLLTQRLVFRVYTAQGQELIAPTEILVRRDFSFNDSQALAKETEERVLLQDMQQDIVEQLLRRLSTLKVGTL